MTTAELLIILACFSLFASVVQGVTGFGFSLVLIGLMATVTGQVVESSFYSNILALVCQLTIIYRLRGRFPWRHAWPMVAGQIVALPVGVWLLAEFGRRPWINHVLGGFVLAIALWLLVAPKKPQVTNKPRRMLGLSAGLSSGLVGGMFNTGGPPAVLYVYSRPISMDSAKLCVQWVFTAMSTYRLIVAGSSGMVSWQVTWMSLAVAPVVAAGALAGMRLGGRVHPELLRKLVYLLLLLIGAKLLVGDAWRALFNA